MKNIIKHIGILIFSLIAESAFAKTPPPPNNRATSGGGTTPVGGGAPIKGGFVILLTAAGAYAYSKWNNKTPDYKVLN